jgi:thiamine biosynthesis lipoprotein ApbE
MTRCSKRLESVGDRRSAEKDRSIVWHLGPHSRFEDFNQKRGTDLAKFVPAMVRLLRIASTVNRMNGFRQDATLSFPGCR